DGGPPPRTDPPPRARARGARQRATRRGSAPAWGQTPPRCGAGARDRAEGGGCWPWVPLGVQRVEAGLIGSIAPALRRVVSDHFDLAPSGDTFFRAQRKKPPETGRRGAGRAGCPGWPRRSTARRPEHQHQLATAVIAGRLVDHALAPEGHQRLIE